MTFWVSPETNYPLGFSLIRNVLHDLIDQQRERDIHKVLITTFHNLSLPYLQITQVGHISHSLTLLQQKMNNIPVRPQPPTVLWANAMGKAFFWALSMQHPSSYKPHFFQCFALSGNVKMRRMEEYKNTNMSQMLLSVGGGKYTHFNHWVVIFITTLIAMNLWHCVKHKNRMQLFSF